MAYVLDGLLIVLFALCVYLGWRRGLIKTASGLIALAAAVAVSVLLSGPVAELVYDKAVEPAVVSALEEQIQDNTVPVAQQVDNALEQMPGFITALLAGRGLDSGEAILDGLRVEEMGASVAEGIAQQVVAPLVCPLLEGLCAILLFILVYMAALLLLRVLDLVARIPFIKQLNRGLGLVAGVCSGALWVIFAVGVITTLTYLCWIPALTPEVLEGTLLISRLRDLLQSLI